MVYVFAKIQAVLWLSLLPCGFVYLVTHCVKLNTKISMTA